MRPLGWGVWDPEAKGPGRPTRDSITRVGLAAHSLSCGLRVRSPWSILTVCVRLALSCPFAVERGSGRARRH